MPCGCPEPDKNDNERLVDYIALGIIFTCLLTVGSCMALFH